MNSVNQLSDDVLLLRSELGYLRDQVLKKDRQLEQQQKDMEQLNTKYVGALDEVANIQHEKDVAEKELEELSSHLLEHAGAMVAHEKRQVHQLQVHVDQLQRELLTQHLPSADAPLVWTRPWLLAADFDHFVHTVQQDPCSQATFSNSQQHQQLQQPQQQQNPSSASILLQYKQLPFLRQAIAADVEPCLTLGQNGRWMKKAMELLIKGPYTPESITLAQLEQQRNHHHAPPCSSTSTSLSSPSSSLQGKWQQRVLDFIDDHRPRWIGDTSMVSSLSMPPSPVPSPPPSIASFSLSCAGCGRPLMADQTHFQWKIDVGKLALLYGLEDDYLILDASCCERLEAVSSFFAFLRQLCSPPSSISPASLDSKPSDLPLASQSPLYVKMLQLRLAMAYARLGLGSTTAPNVQVMPTAAPAAADHSPPAPPSRRVSL
ncbi:hypothetical protein BC940DRAFT_290329 [Gongronella butleri]|nr:hypothetical protein BC940DRAFT_290329 [Gongronella butleri]